MNFTLDASFLSAFHEMNHYLLYLLQRCRKICSKRNFPSILFGYERFIYKSCYHVAKMVFHETVPGV